MTAPSEFRVGDLIQFHHVHDRNAGSIYRIDQIILAGKGHVLGLVFSIGSQITPGARHEYLRDTNGFYALQPTKVGTADPSGG
jgi:hypothetical protein